MPRGRRSLPLLPRTDDENRRARQPAAALLAKAEGQGSNNGATVKPRPLATNPPAKNRNRKDGKASRTPVSSSAVPGPPVPLKRTTSCPSPVLRRSGLFQPRSATPESGAAAKAKASEPTRDDANQAAPRGEGAHRVRSRIGDAKRQRRKSLGGKASSTSKTSSASERYSVEPTKNFKGIRLNTYGTLDVQTSESSDGGTGASIDLSKLSDGSVSPTLSWTNSRDEGTADTSTRQTGAKSTLYKLRPRRGGKTLDVTTDSAGGNKDPKIETAPRTNTSLHYSSNAKAERNDDASTVTTLVSSCPSSCPSKDCRTSKQSLIEGFYEDDASTITTAASVNSSSQTSKGSSSSTQPDRLKRFSNGRCKNKSGAAGDPKTSYQRSRATASTSSSDQSPRNKVSVIDATSLPPITSRTTAFSTLTNKCPSLFKRLLTDKTTPRRDTLDQGDASSLTGYEASAFRNNSSEISEEVSPKRRGRGGRSIRSASVGRRPRSSRGASQEEEIDMDACTHRTDSRSARRASTGHVMGRTAKTTKKPTCGANRNNVSKPRHIVRSASTGSLGKLLVGTITKAGEPSSSSKAAADGQSPIKSEGFRARSIATLSLTPDEGGKKNATKLERTPKSNGKRYGEGSVTAAEPGNEVVARRSRSRSRSRHQRIMSGAGMKPPFEMSPSNALASPSTRSLDPFPTPPRKSSSFPKRVGIKQSRKDSGSATSDDSSSSSGPSALVPQRKCVLPALPKTPLGSTASVKEVPAPATNSLSPPMNSSYKHRRIKSLSPSFKDWEEEVSRPEVNLDVLMLSLASPPSRPSTLVPRRKFVSPALPETPPRSTVSVKEVPAPATNSLSPLMNSSYKHRRIRSLSSIKDWEAEVSRPEVNLDVLMPSLASPLSRQSMLVPQREFVLPALPKTPPRPSASAKEVPVPATNSLSPLMNSSYKHRRTQSLSLRPKDWEAEVSRSKANLDVLTPSLASSSIPLLCKTVMPIQRLLRQCLAKNAVVQRKKSIVTVQSLIRRWACVRHLKSAQVIALRSQAVFRSTVARDSLNFQHYCATRIQTVWRSVFGVMAFAGVIGRIVLIQSVWRMKRIHMEYRELKVKTTLAQSIIRRRIAIKSFTRQREVKAALIIQTNFRRFITKLGFMLTLTDILLCQATARRFLAKIHAARLRHTRDTNAALMIQTNYRRFFVLKIAATLRFARDTKAALMIQTNYRRFNTMLGFRLTLKDIVLCQASARRFLAMKHATILMRITKAALLIQTNYRMHRAKSKSNKESADDEDTSVSSLSDGGYSSRSLSSLPPRMDVGAGSGTRHTLTKSCISAGSISVSGCDKKDASSPKNQEKAVTQSFSNRCSKNSTQQTRQEDVLSLDPPSACLLSGSKSRSSKGDETFTTAVAKKDMIGMEVVFPTPSVTAERNTAKLSRNMASKPLSSLVTPQKMLSRKVSKEATTISLSCRRSSLLKTPTRTKPSVKEFPASPFLNSSHKYRKNKRLLSFPVAVLCKAIVPIQCLVRQYLAKKAVVERKNNIAAARIQAVWRSSGILESINTTKREAKAALIIQTYFRRRMAMDDLLYQISNILMCQAAVRRFLALKHTVRMREVKQRGPLENKAATSIQSLFRGYWGFLSYVVAKFSVVQIQACIRSHLAKGLLKRLKHEKFVRELVNAAVVAIQTHVRRYLAERRVNSMMQTKRKKAATAIQSCFRGHWGFLSYLVVKFSVVQIQACLRRHLAKGLLIRLKRKQKETAAAVAIQSCFRGYQEFVRFIITQYFAIKTQACVRGYQARCRLKRLKRENSDKNIKRNMRLSNVMSRVSAHMKKSASRGKYSGASKTHLQSQAHCVAATEQMPLTEQEYYVRYNNTSRFNDVPLESGRSRRADSIANSTAQNREHMPTRRLNAVSGGAALSPRSYTSLLHFADTMKKESTPRKGMPSIQSIRVGQSKGLSAYTVRNVARQRHRMVERHCWYPPESRSK